MAKKPAANQPDEPNKGASPESGESSGIFENLGKKIDDLPPVRDAEQAVLRAKAELDKAQESYRKIRRQAVDELRDLRQKNVGDVLEQTLDYVRRHPGQGIGLAALLGFFLGRLFRR